MLGQYNPIDVEIILRETHFEPPFPHLTDRPAWERTRVKLGPDQVNEFIHLAEEAAVEPIPFLRASLWLECKRTGERRGYEDPTYRRRTMMRDLAIGECLENQARFIDPLVDVIWAICEESSWAYPAHHTDLADMERPYIDLGAATTAFELAEIDALVGSVLPVEVRKRIRHEVNQRILTPYLNRHDFWWMFSHSEREVNNWTAVCSAGVMASAIYLETDLTRLSDILTKGLRSLDDYLATFDVDGGSTEGPGYWTYGFGYYTLIAHLVELRTAGKVCLMDGEFMRKIGAYPLRTMLSQDMYVNFSDAPRYAVFNKAMLVYLSQRLDLPNLIPLAVQQPDQEPPDLIWLLRTFTWDIPEQPGECVIPAKHDWYSGMMWMFSRYKPEDPNALVLAAKGGHNDEMHNHNDVGNFIVHFCQESIIADVGCGRYTLQYFSDLRYEYFCASSLGHSVPSPRGLVQQPGRQFCASLLEHSTNTEHDILHLELKDAYPVDAGLKSLQRKLVFHREEPHGWVELEDSFSYQDGPGLFESALTTFVRVEPGENAFILHGMRGKLRIGYDPETVAARVDLYQEVDLAEGIMEVNRIVFTMVEPTQEGKIHLEILPL